MAGGKSPADDVTNVIHISELDDITGSVLNDRYEIIRKLGEGGMGEVYKGRHIGLDRKVAIKLLRLDLAQEAELIERFNREAKMMAAIKHGNVVEIYDFGCSNNGVLYQVMEYLEGDDLLNIISPGEIFEMDYALEIIISVLSALEKIHEAGIIHRDLKPDNIFISHPDTPDERVVILDFGISKIKRLKERRLTQEGRVVGTPYYMSPEQARAEDLDLHTDIWSVGVILFEMLTGCLPFNGETPMEVLGGLLANPVIPPNMYNPDIPEDLNYVVLRAMDKDLENRYHSAAEFRQDLENFQESLRLVQPDPATAPEAAAEVTAIYRDGEEAKAPSFLRAFVFLAIGAAVLLGAPIGLWISGVFSEDAPATHVSPADSDTKIAGKADPEPISPAKNTPAVPAAILPDTEPQPLVKTQPQLPPVPPPVTPAKTWPRAEPLNPPDASTEPPPPVVIPSEPIPQKAPHKRRLLLDPDPPQKRRLLLDD